MINGEGTTETISEVVSPDPSDSFSPSGGPKSDGSDASPALSRYSSCGESEFERYSSANSALNTPSMCSSFGVFNDRLESEFGSMKSCSFGDDYSSLENFSLGGNFERNQVEQRLLNSGIEIGSKEGGLNEFELSNNERVSMLNDSNFPSVSGVKNDFNEGVSGEDEIKGFGVKCRVEIVDRNEFRSQKNFGGELLSIGSGNGSQDARGIGESSSSHMVAKEVDGLNLQSDLIFDGRGMRREEDENSSRYEHSEDDDSIYNDGSDDEQRSNSYFHKNIQYHKEGKTANENPLLINSSVAFGSEDWDDFEQEMEGTTLASLTLDSFHEQKDHNLESERNILSCSSASFPIIIQTGQGKDVSQVLISSQQVQVADELAEGSSSYSETPVGILAVGEPEQVEDVRDSPFANHQVQDVEELTEYTKNNSMSPIGFSNFQEPKQEDTRVIPVTTNQVGDADESASCRKNFYGNDVFEMEQEPLAEEAPLEVGLNDMDCGMDGEHQCVNAEKDPLDVVGNDENRVLENQEMGNSKTQLNPFSDTSIKQLFSHSSQSPRNINAEFFEDCVPKSLPSVFGNDTKTTWTNSVVSADLLEVHPTPIKKENLELSDFYDELVNEMEEILLDSGESPGSRFPQGSMKFQSHLSLPLRDGGSTASTSGTYDVYPFIQHPWRIDGVEVVGAKQKKGDVSLSEKLVGVKEYTVYKIRVWSGKDQWEVERRYRDFFTLYRRLKTFFADHGWILPSPWSSVDKESRKIFGNASPDVISERSVLIQECLCSILHSKFFSSPPSALIWFLSPQESIPSSLASDTSVHQSTSFTRGADTENILALGKTISLTVEILPYKSIKQMLEAQHYTCAGCHKHFDDGKTLIQDFVQTFGWGKPRLCEYTGQLFCSLCHTNETAVLPARVLHHWDFTQYPVSQLAKSYLDSIHDQPMLCVSAVNPFLFSKVPALHHVTGVRKKIGTMLPYVRCPFRRTINKGLGSRRYLLESNDFFALRELIDLSKGAFAALPVMVETVSTKILEHITEQCLICCDVGVPCGARQACNDPSSLIFPFQEGEVEKCPSCKSVFHKPCFKKLTDCPCGAHLRVDEAVGTAKRVGQKASGEVSGAGDALGRRSGSTLPAEFLYRLFPKVKLEKSREREHRGADNVILMGSLPSTSLEL